MTDVTDSLLRATSWTLAHSIWQGFIMAVLAAILITAAKKTSPALRYNLLCGLLATFLVTVGFTFRHEYNHINSKDLNSLILSMDVIWPSGDTLGSGTLSALIIRFLNDHAASIVLIWLGALCLKSIAVCGNIAHIYKIRNSRNQPVSAYWDDKLTELAQTMQISTKIAFLESRIVKVPSVIGYFKPLILMPAGLITNVPPEQIEAILLHELAHIRRKDCLVNLIQRIAEIIFFFNPGVLWLSLLIKEERENCCDDLAVSVTKNKTQYVQALISFQQYSINDNALIMGFGGKKQYLLNRAKRIINNDTKSLNRSEMTFLSIAVFAVFLLMSTYSGSATADTAKQLSNAAKTTPANGNTEVITGNDTIPMPAKKTTIKQYSLPFTNMALTAPPFNAEKERSMPECGPGPVIYGSEPFPGTINTTNSSQPFSLTQPADDRRNQAERQVCTVVPDTVASAVLSGTQGKTASVYSRTSTISTENKKQSHERLEITAEKIIGSPIQISEAIISELTTEKIISDKNKLSYNLSNKSLVVNGVVQPSSVHRRFSHKYLSRLRQKYNRNENVSINYNYDISNTIACN